MFGLHLLGFRVLLPRIHWELGVKSVFRQQGSLSTMIENKMVAWIPPWRRYSLSHLNSIPGSCLGLLVVHVLGIPFIHLVNIDLRHVHVRLSLQMGLLLRLNLLLMLLPEVVDVSLQQVFIIDENVFELILIELGFALLDSPVLKIVTYLHEFGLHVQEPYLLVDGSHQLLVCQHLGWLLLLFFGWVRLEFVLSVLFNDAACVYHHRLVLDWIFPLENTAESLLAAARVVAYEGAFLEIGLRVFVVTALVYQIVSVNLVAVRANCKNLSG